MQFENPPPLSLAGSLLLADPAMRDPNFSRSVLYVRQHTLEAGAEGFVLNRPLGKTVGQLTDSDGFAALKKVPVFLGGPVQTEQLIFAVLHWDFASQRLIMESRIAPKAAIMSMEYGYEVRAYVGFAGWSAGQLETELRERAWITRRADANLLGWDVASLWRNSMESLSPWHYLLSKMPEDPSLS